MKLKHQLKILLVFILSNNCFLWSQNESEEKAYYTVAASSGLSVRSEPSITSEKLGKFPSGEYVELIEDTGLFLSILDNGLPVNGSWFKVRRMNQTWDKKPALTGYVFSGYLLKNESRPYNPSNAMTAENSILKFKNFDIAFYFYKIDNRYESHNVIKNDTMYVYEDVFNDLSDKLIQIKPKVNTHKVELFYTYKERVWEYDTSTNNSEKNYSWEGNYSFKKLPLTREIGLFHKIEYEEIETSRQLNLKLKDTMVHYPGEMGGATATMSYKGRPCLHSVSDVILKIVLHHNNGTVETKYISINLSYGC